MTSKVVEKQERNARGIPKAPFIADVAEFVGAELDVEGALKEFQAALAKYRYMDHNLAQRRRSLEEKIPDIKKTLTMIEFLQERRGGKMATGDEDDIDLDEEEDAGEKTSLRTTFELNDTLYAEADLGDTDTVYLWLGANVMLSYKIPQAITLLTSKLESAESGLANIIEDLEFLREQITIMEVNTARVYNWDVKRRRELREKEARQGGGLLPVMSKEES